MKVMSTPEKEILCKIVDESPLLEYKLKTLEMPEDYDDELVYEIPDEDKEKVFKELWPVTALRWMRSSSTSTKASHSSSKTTK